MTRMYIVIACFALVGAAGCKRHGTGGGGGGTPTGSGGGGGSAWFTGSSGMLASVGVRGDVEADLSLGQDVQLAGIACRYEGEAWVVGSAGTLLYTDDGGDTWTAQTVPTSADLRALATQDTGPVFVAGDGVFLESTDTGATWQAFGDGQAHFRALAAAQAGSTVLAVSDDGGLWSFDGTLARRATLPGARAIAVSPDGTQALAVGTGMWRSLDAGATWTRLAADPSIAYDDVRLGEDGRAIAVGAAGAIATITPEGAVTVQHAGTADLHTVHVPDPDALDATGYAGGDGGTVWITHDSGASWQRGPTLSATVRGVDEIGFGHR